MCRICSMPDNKRPAIAVLRYRFDARPFRVSEAVEVGVSRTTLHRLAERGELARAGRGILQLPDAGMGMLSSLAVVSARAPHGTICLNSALAYWDLTDEIPATVHLAVSRGAHRPVIEQPPTRVHVFNAATFQLERQQARTDADEPFWIYSAERSIVDAMRMSRWVGRDLALHALNRYMSRPGSDPARLAELARELGGGARLAPALETLLS
jgi:predicted transcriptional regulator of viral defense system